MGKVIKLIKDKSNQNTKEEEAELYFQEGRTEINNKFYKEKDYRGCIDSCLELIGELINKNINERRYFFYAYIMLTQAHSEINNYHKAIHYCKKALEFVDNKDNNLCANWIMARCYEQTDIKQAEYYFNICIILGKQHEKYSKEYSIVFKFNIASLHMNFNLMQSLLEEFLSLEKTEYYSYALNDLYKIFCKKYAWIKDFDKSLEYAQSISDIVLKEEMIDLINIQRINTVYC